MNKNETKKKLLKVEDCPCPTCVLSFIEKIRSGLDNLELPALRNKLNINYKVVWAARAEVLKVEKEVTKTIEESDCGDREKTKIAQLEDYLKQVKSRVEKILKKYNLFRLIN